MSKFEFKNNGIHLDIAGCIFCVPATESSAKRLQNIGREMQIKATELAQCEDEGALTKALDFMWDGIDSILGVGASDAIFTGRERSIYDAIDVIAYISQEFEAFQKGKQGQYENFAKNHPTPLPTNRAQRREVDAQRISTFSPTVTDADPRVLAAAIEALIRQASHESIN